MCATRPQTDTIDDTRVGGSCLIDLDRATVRDLLGHFELPQRQDLALLPGGRLAALISIEKAGEDPFADEELRSFGALGETLARKLAESARFKRTL